jgi:hypothetical protein
MGDCPWINCVVDEVTNIIGHLWNVVSSLPNSEIICKHTHVDSFGISHWQCLTNEVFHVYDKKDR